jgi:hypothetical protein
VSRIPWELIGIVLGAGLILAALRGQEGGVGVAIAILGVALVGWGLWQWRVRRGT